VDSSSFLSIERQPRLRLARLDTGARNVLTLEALRAGAGRVPAAP
jgi:hypothetical protein